jgi:hypothetical protein
MIIAIKSFWSRHRFLVTIIAVIVALVAGYWITQTWQEYAGNQRLQAAMAVAAADNPDWQWGPQFEVGTLKPEENVARDITEWMLKRGLTESVMRNARTGWIAEYEKWEVKFYKGGREPEELEIRAHPNRRLPTDLVRDVTAVLTREDALADLEMLRHWVDRPAGRYEYRVQGLMLLHLLPMVQKIRELAEVLAWDSLWQVEQGRADLALLDLRTIAMVARSFGDDPLMICQLVRTAVGGFGVKKLERVLAQTEKPDVKQLELLQAEYLAEAERPLLLAMARGCRAAEDHDMALLQTNLDQREKLLNSWAITNKAPKTNFAWLDLIIQTVWKKFWLFPSSATWPKERAVMLELQNQFVETAKLPESQWAREVKRIASSAKDTDFVMSWLEGFWISNWDAGIAQKVTEALIKYRSLLRCGAAACAAERFRLEKNRWPGKWDELVPHYLPAVPIDSFTQKPIIWKTLPDGLVFYSVGRDGKDDGGDVLEGENGAPKDVGIRLWATGARRQAPVTEEKK